MERVKGKKILATLSLVIAVALFIVIKVIAPVCSGMVEMANGNKGFMKCHYSSIMVVFLTIILLINAISALISKQDFTFGMITVTASILIILAFNNKLGIGICVKPEMACHITAPLVTLCAIIEIIIGIISIIVLRKDKGRMN